MRTSDGTIFGKTADSVGYSDVIEFVAPQKNHHRIIRSAKADNGPNDYMACDYIPETVVLNTDSFVEYRYALFHNDNEDILTDKRFFENNADTESTKK